MNVIEAIAKLFVKPTPVYDITEIPEGATKADVERLWGRAKWVIGGDGDETWEYSVPFKIYVLLTFDLNGRLIAKYRSGVPI